MNELLTFIAKLYGGGEKLRFLSDEHGNILWQSDNVKQAILFPLGLDSDISDGHTAKVKIGDNTFCAECSILNYNSERYYLWTADSITDILMKFGKTDTYTDASFMLSITKSDIESIIQYNDKLIEAAPDIYRKSAEKQKLHCLNLMRHIETMSELTAVIYEKGTKSQVMQLKSELDTVVAECNSLLTKKSVSINTDFSDKAERACFAGGRYLFFVMLLSVIKKAVNCSDREYFSVMADCDDKQIYITVPFIIEEEKCSDVISNDFEIYCASLYAQYLGGRLTQKTEDRTGIIEITLPLYNGDVLSSPGRYKAAECKKIAEAFMSAVKRD